MDTNASTEITEMSTLSQVLGKLHHKGWDHEFHYAPKGFYLADRHFYDPSALEIIKTYRFEGVSNPSDSSVLYIIRTREGKIGYMIDAYGIYSNHDDETAFANFLRHVPVSRRDEQLLFDL
jgi:hypothetical protein